MASLALPQELDKLHPVWGNINKEDKWYQLASSSPLSSSKPDILSDTYILFENRTEDSKGLWACALVYEDVRG